MGLENISKSSRKKGPCRYYGKAWINICYTLIITGIITTKVVIGHQNANDFCQANYLTFFNGKTGKSSNTNSDFRPILIVSFASVSVSISTA